MSLISWYESRMPKLRWYDIGYIKGAVFAFTLMLVKFWPWLLALEWHWYLVIAIVFCIRPFYAFYFKK
jgi:hypothetical protein